MRKYILTGLAALVLGSIGTRFGQHVVQDNYSACMEAGLPNVTSIEGLFGLQERCMPNPVLLKVFFW